MARPGLYEVESGATLGDVLALAGGIQGTPKAILLGGAAGGFVTADDLDIKLTFEDARAGGYTLGSGVVMVFNEAVDLVDPGETVAAGSAAAYSAAEGRNDRSRAAGAQCRGRRVRAGQQGRYRLSGNFRFEKFRRARRPGPGDLA